MASKKLKVQGLTLYVTDEHVNHKGEFILHCKELNFSERTLKETTCVEDALQEAIHFIESYLLAKLASLDLIKLKLVEKEDDKG